MHVWGGDWSAPRRSLKSKKTIADRGPTCGKRNWCAYLGRWRGAAVNFLVVCYPVKKHGPWVLADLRVVTLMAIPIRKLISPRSPAPPPRLLKLEGISNGTNKRTPFPAEHADR